MSQPEHFDVLVFGSGAGGKLTAWHMAGSGRRTAVVERKWIGGSCPNIACLPTKNEIRSAEVAHLARHGAEFGTMTGAIKVNMAIVRQRKRDMVDALVAAHLQNYKASGAELIMGEGRFIAPKTLEVRLNDGGTRTLVGDQVFINVGTHAAIPSVPGLEAAKPLTHIEALELDTSAGASDRDRGRLFRPRIGAGLPSLRQRGDGHRGRASADGSGGYRRLAGDPSDSRDEGIQVLVAAELLHVRGQSGKGVSLAVRTSSGEQNIEGSDILVAAGTCSEHRRDRARRGRR